eukprot:3435465-Pyramimonas_sp.AAC.3
MAAVCVVRRVHASGAGGARGTCRRRRAAGPPLPDGQSQRDGLHGHAHANRAGGAPLTLTLTLTLALALTSTRLGFAPIRRNW